MRHRILAAVSALLLLLSACQAPAGPPPGSSSEGSSSGLTGSSSETADPVEEPVQYYIPDPEDASRYIKVSSEELDENRHYWIVDPEDSSRYIEVVLTQSGKRGEDVALTGSGKDEAYEYVIWTGPNLTQEKLDEVLAGVMEDYSAVAVSVAAIEDGEVTVSGAWGWAVTNEREMTADTKVRVASLTKVSLGLCAMAMAEDGLLELDAPLSTYWGEDARNPRSKTQPSAYTLMTHTSSLTDQGNQTGLSNLRSRLQKASSWRSMEPGNGGYWYYSNFGFCVLGATLELAADQVLDNYLQARYLEPMGIRASLFPGNLEADEVACLYSSSGAVQRSVSAQTGQGVPSKIGQGASYFPGGLTISAPDLARLVSVLVNDGVYDGVRYLSQESVADMETPRFAVDYLEGTYPFDQCLVLRHQEDLMGRSHLYYHTGSAYGVHSLLSYDPEEGDGVVVITVGAPRRVNDRGLYALCADLSEKLYAEMRGGLA